MILVGVSDNLFVNMIFQTTSSNWCYAVTEYHVVKVSPQRLPTEVQGAFFHLPLQMEQFAAFR